MVQLQSSCSEGKRIWGTQPRAWVSRCAHCMDQ